MGVRPVQGVVAACHIVYLLRVLDYGWVCVCVCVCMCVYMCVCVGWCYENRS